MGGVNTEEFSSLSRLALRRLVVATTDKNVAFVSDVWPLMPRWWPNLSSLHITMPLAPVDRLLFIDPSTLTSSTTSSSTSSSTTNAVVNGSGDDSTTSSVPLARTMSGSSHASKSYSLGMTWSSLTDLRLCAGSKIGSLSDDKGSGTLSVIAMLCPNVHHMEVRIGNAAMAGLRHFSSLRSLEITPYSELSRDAIKYIASCTSLHELTLFSPRRNTYTSFALFANLTQLTSLLLYSSLRPIEVHDIKGWPQHLPLKRLCLSHCGLSDDVLPLLHDARQLTELDISRNEGLSDDALDNLRLLPSTLRILNISNCRRLSSRGAAAILHLTSLQSLDITACLKLATSEIKRFATMTTLQTLVAPSKKQPMWTDAAALLPFNTIGCRIRFIS
jgi:hypothetical protein